MGHGANQEKVSAAGRGGGKRQERPAPGRLFYRAQLVAHADDAPQKLADAVARAAREKQQDMPDDVTVMALRLRAVE